MRIIIALVFIVFSCSENANLEITTNNSSLKIDEFKTVFFQMCLTKSVGRQKVAELIAEDNSTSSELTLGVNNYRKISELADSISVQIRADSLAWQNKICKDCSQETLAILKADGKIGKRVFDYCLGYYTSTELDSIARTQLN